MHVIDSRIPREEVEWMAEIVNAELQQIIVSLSDTACQSSVDVAGQGC